MRYKGYAFHYTDILAILQSWDNNRADSNAIWYLYSGLYSVDLSGGSNLPCAFGALRY